MSFCKIAMFGDFNTKTTSDLNYTEKILNESGLYFSKKN